MFTWITGPRITDVVEDLQPENNYESTFIEAPETPAHQFAVNAFKHALFGTPAPADANNASKRNDKKAKLDAVNAKNIVITPPVEDGPPLSPSKLPGGILMTPGTASKGRKTVSFGSHVVDNEGKCGNIGRSGIPNDCPGKFPSPWTPGTQLKLEPGSDNRPRTKFTAALLDARTTKQPKSGQKPKAKDDSDITIDLGAPRSESGKYWKEQYESYAERSEKEMKKIIAKQQLAKKFAMKKDGEVTELTTHLEQERKKFRQREQELEQQNKDFQERLQQAMAENSSAAIEIATLKSRIAVLERSPFHVVHEKPSFQIFEDTSKGMTQTVSQREPSPETTFVPSFSMASSGKENHSPGPRRHRRQSVPERLARPNPPPTVDTAQGEASIILGKSPRAPMRCGEVLADAIRPLAASEQMPRSPLHMRKIEPANEKFAPKSPDAVPPSSPLPMPSPGIDPWIELNNQSPIQPVDKLAIPNYSGKPFSRPEWEPAPKRQHAAKPASHTRHGIPSKVEAERVEKSTVFGTRAEASSRSRPARTLRNVEDGPNTTTAGGTQTNNEMKNSKVEKPKMPETVTNFSPTDPKFDISKITAHHAEGSSKVKKDRVEILPVDRKEQARRRLEERKRLRKIASS